jgi:hypothetical protein
MTDQRRPSPAGAGLTLVAATPPPGEGTAITGLVARNGAGFARVYARSRDI